MTGAAGYAYKGRDFYLAELLRRSKDVELERDENAIPLVYGRTTIEIKPIAYKTSSIGNRKKAYTILAYPICEGEIDSIGQIYLNDTPVLKAGTSLTNGMVDKDVLEKKFKFLMLEVKSGKSDQTPFESITESWWDKQKKGKNVALLLIRFYNKNAHGMNGDDLKVKVEVKGRKIKQLEEKSLTGYSNNPASILFDLITNRRFGAGVDPSSIDMQSFISVAKKAKALGLKADGVLDTAKKIKDLCNLITQVFSGDLFEFNGLISLGMRQRGASTVLSFDKSNIINKIEVEHQEARIKSNRLIGTYEDFTGEKQPDIVIPKEITPEMIADGSLKTKTINYTMISDRATAERVSNIDYQSMSYRKRIKFDAGFEAFKLKPFDGIKVTDTHNLLNNVTFIVDEVDRNLTKNKGICSIIATEYIDKDFTSKEPIAPPKVYDIQGKFQVTPPTNFKIENKSFTDFSNGILSWDASDDLRVFKYEIEYKLSSSDDWLSLETVEKTSLPIRNLKPGIYDFSVRSINRFSFASDRLSIENIDMSDSRTYPTPEAIKISNNKKSTTISETNDWLIGWSDTTLKPIGATGPITDGETFAAYFSHYEVKIMAGSEVKRVDRSANPYFTYSYSDALKDGLSRNIRFEIRFVSKSGAKSKPGVLNAVNNQSLLPENITVKGGVAGLFLDFSPPIALDHAGVNIYISKTSGFTPGADNLTATLVNSNSFSKAYSVTEDETYYLKLASFDTFGKDNLAFSGEYEFTVKTIVKFEMPEITDSMLVGELGKQISKIPLNTAAISKETNDRINAITKSADNLAKEILDRTSGDTGLDKKISSVAAKTNGNTSVIASEKSASATRDAALGKRIDILTTTVGGNTSNIASEKSASATRDSALGSRIDAITTTVGGNTSKIASEQKASASRDAALGKRIDVLTITVGGNTSNITSEQTASASRDAALGKRIDAMSAQVGKATALIQRVDTVEAGLKGKASASSVSTLQSTVKGNTSSIQVNTSAVNGMKSRYTIRVGANGLIAGVGLMTDSTTKKAEVSVLASNFYVVNSATDIGKSEFMPFAVSGNKTYIKDAFIKNASITDAKISTLSASKIKTGTLSASQTISAGRAHMGSAPGNYRFWAGTDVKGAGTAPFSVKDDGTVMMQKGVIGDSVKIGAYTTLLAKISEDSKAGTGVMKLYVPSGSFTGVGVLPGHNSTAFRSYGQGKSAFFMSGPLGTDFPVVTMEVQTNAKNSTAIKAQASNTGSYVLDINGKIKHNGIDLKGPLVTTQSDFMGWKQIYSNSAGAKGKYIPVATSMTTRGANWEVMVIYGKGTEHFCCRFFLPNGYFQDSNLSMKFNGDTGGAVYIFGTNYKDAANRGRIYSSNYIFKIYLRQIEMRS